jgi:hypothetical protein
MSFQDEDLEEEQEPDFDPGYPFGGSAEPYDIERDEDEVEECDYCGSCIDNFHTCDCGAELTKKQCHDQSGLCQTCLRLI